MASWENDPAVKGTREGATITGGNPYDLIGQLQSFGRYLMTDPFTSRPWRPDDSPLSKGANPYTQVQMDELNKIPDRQRKEYEMTRRVREVTPRKIQYDPNTAWLERPEALYSPDDGAKAYKERSDRAWSRRARMTRETRIQEALRRFPDDEEQAYRFVKALEDAEQKATNRVTPGHEDFNPPHQYVPFKGTI